MTAADFYETDAVETINVDVALIHYPVQNKNGEVIGSAVTNLDLHDIARVSRTYGVQTYHVVTPYKDQQQLITEILDHWLKGHGAEYNSKRKEALSIVRISDDLDGVIRRVTDKWQCRPTILATSARTGDNTWSYREAARRIRQGEHVLVLFGTGWGMTDDLLARADALLPAIEGPTEYNHLSVRSAVSIVLDRLLGNFADIEG